MSASQEAAQAPQAERPATGGQERGPGPSRRGKVIAGLVAGGLLMLAGWSMFESKYLELRQVMDHGTAGTFTLESCERSGSSRSGPSTTCTGTFRSAGGAVVVEDIELTEKNDARSLSPGASFPVRATVTEYGSGHDVENVLRDDPEGRGNLTQNGIGSAGIGVLGLTTAALGSLALWPRGSGARRAVRTTLIVGAVAGAVMWVAGLTAGGGFLT
ncbi:hypothetical protein [Streptomyces sp. HNM0574]|uniref:hypothetical protein n=1 Tax=Streptomyces sp. HNM0574 TaxID=2714954 RepID=UPI00146B9CCF|nr:hypothetical protein [Streptomyces sp. HNM0574]NLU69900.1 hypothetical protein [Streptomyces sp. HNM0574]